MPFDSNGTFNRARFWVSDAAANIKIRADYHDAHDSDLASGLSTCITKDGRTQPSANLPMNGKKLINHGSTLASDGPQTVATKDYVDNFKAFATGLTITGANYPNGMIHFGATTGITGISWVNADMSWVGKTAEAGKWRQRLCVTNDAQGAGAEIITVDKQGFLGISNYITHNLSHDGTTWRTNKKGIGTALYIKDGTFISFSNDTATLQDNQTTTLQPFWTLGQTTMSHVSNSSAIWKLQKKASGQSNSIQGLTGSSIRWVLELGNGTAESGTAYVGSNFAISAYNNVGAGGKTMMLIDRSTNRTTFTGDIATSTNFISTDTLAVLATTGAGTVALRPNGEASGAGQFVVGSGGTITVSGGSQLGLGQQGRNGTGGGYSANWHNWLWSGGFVYALVDNTNVGAIQMVCDYRTKRNAKALPAMWEMVKKLRPIQYQYKAFKGLEGDKDDDEIRWGFVAHELQGTLTKSAATFDKDAPNAIQSPNLMAICAALTKALQEAMQRIEALEAKA